MRVYLGCFVYDDSSTPTWISCGCCNEQVLEKIGTRAIAACSTDCRRFARHDRLANIFLKWLVFIAGLAFLGKRARVEAENLLCCTPHQPADALIFPHLTAPGEDPCRPAAINLSSPGRLRPLTGWGE